LLRSLGQQRLVLRDLREAVLALGLQTGAALRQLLLAQRLHREQVLQRESDRGGQRAEPARLAAVAIRSGGRSHPRAALASDRAHRTPRSWTTWREGGLRPRCLSTLQPRSTATCSTAELRVRRRDLQVLRFSGAGESNDASRRHD